MIWRSLKYLALTVVMTLTSFVLSLPMAQASILTSATLEVSTHAASATADHTMQFVTPSGVDASSDTIVIEYASSFSLGSVAVGDIDLAVDDDAACDGSWTEKTLAASAAAGTWGVAVSGQRVTLTAPTDAAAGEIAAGRCVQIEIGTHADSGSNQITNPGSSGSYDVDVYGAFGDQAMYAVGITGTSGLPVTAIVPSGDESSGGPTTPGDTTGPVISNVLVSNITGDSALITWETDEPASRTLSYGLTTDYAIGAHSDALLRTSHTQSVSGLSEQTTYHFQIITTDDSGNETTSEDYTFTTLDLTAPVVALEITGVSEVAADIAWNTDEPTTSVLQIDETTVYVGSSLATSDVQTISDLSPATTYTVTVEVTDASGNSASVTEAFTTLEDLAPGNVSDFRAIGGEGIVTLTWVNPTDPDFAYVRLLARTDSFPTSPADGTLVYEGDGVGAIHVGLVNGQEYFYTIFAVDDGRNVSSGATDSATPVAPPARPVDEDDEEDADIDEDVDVDTDAGPDDDADTRVDSDTDADVDAAPEPDDVDDVEPALEDDVEEDEAAPLPEPSVLIPRSHVRFLVARDAIELTPRGSTVRVLGGRPLTVELDMVHAPADIISVELAMPNGTFLMNPDSIMTRTATSSFVEAVDTTLYTARVLSPRVDGALRLHINYTTGETQVMEYVLDVRGDGSVRHEDGHGLDEASVALFQRAGSWQLWSGASYVQANPQQTTEEGFYAWYVPNGTYRIEVVKDGYTTFQSAGIAVGDNIFNAPVELITVLPTVDEMIEEGIAPAFAVTRQVLHSVKVLRQNPAVQRTADIATPVVAVSALSTAGLLAGALNGLRFLQYLFTAPFLLFRRRRRKRWGVVYDSLRKVPVDLAIVRLLDAQTKRVVKSQVTDRQGRYLFLVQPGVYLVDVRKEGFTFPTSHLSAQKRDGEYLDLYHGERIEVREADAVVAANIPVDPAGEAVKTPAKLKWERLVRHAIQGISMLGLAVSIVIAVMQPTAWTVAVALIQVAALALFVRLAIPRKPKRWGIVYDSRTRRPLTNAIVRIFDPKYNKLLETQVTDSRGRYAFLVGPSEYYTTYERPGYTKVEVRPIDRTDTADVSYVSIDIGLKKQNNA